MAVTKRACKQCGIEYIPKHGNSASLYCSKECVYEHQKTFNGRKYQIGQREPVLLTCENCKLTFLKRKSFKKYCSKRCAGEARKVERKIVTCKICGKDISIRLETKILPLTCSNACNIINRSGSKYNKPDKDVDEIKKISDVKVKNKQLYYKARVAEMERLYQEKYLGVKK